MQSRLRRTAHIALWLLITRAKCLNFGLQVVNFPWHAMTRHQRGLCVLWHAMTRYDTQLIFENVLICLRSCVSERVKACQKSFTESVKECQRVSKESQRECQRLQECQKSPKESVKRVPKRVSKESQRECPKSPKESVKRVPKRVSKESQRECPKSPKESVKRVRVSKSVKRVSSRVSSRVSNRVSNRVSKSVNGSRIYGVSNTIPCVTSSLYEGKDCPFQSETSFSVGCHRDGKLKGGHHILINK